MKLVQEGQSSITKCNFVQDVRFVKRHHLYGNCIKHMSARMFDVSAYTGKKCKKSEGHKLLEVETTWYKISTLENGG